MYIHNTSADQLVLLSVPQAALDEGGDLDLMEKGQRLAAVGKALSTLVGSRKIITTVIETGKRVGVEFDKAHKELTALAAAA